MSRAGTYWCLVTCGEDPEGLIFWSIYSENYIEADWQSPFIDLIVMMLSGRHIFMGDFNLHHPIWDIAGRISIKANIFTNLAQ